MIVNFRDRYAMRRKVELGVDIVPPELAGGRFREWTVDATHSNVWHDHRRAELEMTSEGTIGSGPFRWSETMLANSVVLVELLGEAAR